MPVSFVHFLCTLGVVGRKNQWLKITVTLQCQYDSWQARFANHTSVSTWSIAYWPQ